MRFPATGRSTKLSLIVYDDIAELKVQAFAAGICRNEDACLVSELAKSIVSFFDAHAAVQDRNRIILTNEDALQVFLRRHEFSKDEYKAVNTPT